MPSCARSRNERRPFLAFAATPAPTAVPAVGDARLEGTPRKPSLSGADLRNAQKEFAAAGRKLEKLANQVTAIHTKMAEHDQSDFNGLAEMSAELVGLHEQTAKWETRWLELSELLGQ